MDEFACAILSEVADWLTSSLQDPFGGEKTLYSDGSTGVDTGGADTDFSSWKVN